jgi:hypothetical protein
MVNKLQEWLISPLIEDEARAQEEDNLEYCLTLLPRYVVSDSHEANWKSSRGLSGIEPPSHSGFAGSTSRHWVSMEADT